MGTGEIQRFAVVVPAADEQDLLGAAIEGVWEAAAHVDGAVELVVVANGCRDRTAEIAADHGAHVIIESDPNVGAARAIGAAWALRSGADGLWLACTDADSLVPHDWLACQARYANLGFDLFLGTVRLPREDQDRHRRWVDRYLAGRTHVHGANMGVRAAMYHDVGGFRPLVAHEDADLVDRLRLAGALTAWVADVPVTTSARTDHRAPEGVGADLERELQA